MRHDPQETSPTPGEAQPVEVYFDGACPLCRAEIGLYKRLGAKARFHDLTDGGATPEGVDCAAALKRFHVTDSRGEVRSGARAFAELWKATPGVWRPLGHLAAAPPFVWIGEALYRVFLVIRPGFQALARRAERSGG